MRCPLRGWGRRLLLALLVGSGAAPARAAAVPDSALVWLAHGTAAYAARQPAVAYPLFERVARLPGEVGLAARLAQIHILTHLQAPAAARIRLRALPPLARQQPWLRIGGLMATVEALPLNADGALRCSKARQIIQELNALTPPDDPRRAQAWLLLARQHFQMSAYDSALFYAQRARVLLHRRPTGAPPESPVRQAALPPLHPLAFYALLGEIQIHRSYYVADLDDPRLFQAYCRSAEAYLDTAQHLAPDSLSRANIWHKQATNFSNWATSTEGPAGDALARRAHACFVQTLRFDPRPAQQVLTLALEAQLTDRFGDPVTALALFQRALGQLAPGTDVRNPLSLPASFGETYPVGRVLYILEEKSAICRALADQTHRLDYLQAYHAHASRIAEVLAFQRRLATLGRDAGDAALQASRPLENDALAVAAGLALYRRTRQARYLEEAFRLTENVKAWRLLIRLGSDRPASLLRADNQLLSAWRQRTEEHQQWQELNGLARQYPPLRRTAAMGAAADSLAAAGQRLTALTTLLRTRHPTLYAHATAGDFALPQRPIQQALPPDGSVAAVEFLRRTAREDGTGQEWLYAFVIRPDSTCLLEIPLPLAFPDSVQALTAALARPGSAAYLRLAPQFYQWLLAPVARVLPPDVTRLVIAPDGELWKVPFEALLTRPVPATQPADYRTLPYAVRRWTISYAHSLTLYTRRQQKPSPRQPATIFALAPFGDASDPQGLPFSTHFLRQLEATTAGRYLFGPTATPQAFRAAAPGSAVVHLATHAVPDLNDLRASRLQLAGGVITLADLFDLDLHPQLVVLSACQTGIGKLTTPSEGLTSLSWGFSYMGAASTLATLWRVDDAATARLLRRFYTGLHQRRSRVQALHDAKRVALDSARTSAEADPFYWAGLVLTGDERPLPLAPAAAAPHPGPVRLALWGAISGVLLLSGAWWWLGRRMRG